jgi:hypothetical protein
MAASACGPTAEHRADSWLRSGFVEAGDAIFVVLMVWPGGTCLIEPCLRHERRPNLAERLLPFQPRSVADEAEEWLNSRQ